MHVRELLLTAALGLAACTGRPAPADSGDGTDSETSTSETGEPASCRPELCVEVERIIAREDHVLLCGITPTAHVLTYDTSAGTLAISRIDDELGLVEVAQLDGFDFCGAFAHDPANDRFWLVYADPPGSVQLYALDSSGGAS